MHTLSGWDPDVARRLLSTIKISFEFFNALLSYFTVAHSPFTKPHQSFACWNTSGLGSFLLSDLLVIDGKRTNGDPKLLRALKGSVAPGLINLFVLCSYSRRRSEVYISRHMSRHTCLLT